MQKFVWLKLPDMYFIKTDKAYIVWSVLAMMTRILLGNDIRNDFSVYQFVLSFVVVGQLTLIKNFMYKNGLFDTVNISKIH